MKRSRSHKITASNNTHHAHKLAVSIRRHHSIKKVVYFHKLDHISILPSFLLVAIQIQLHCTCTHFPTQQPTEFNNAGISALHLKPKTHYK